MKITDELNEALLDLTVDAQRAGIDMIANANAIYRYSDVLSPHRVQNALREMREGHERVGAALRRVETVLLRPRVAMTPAELRQQLHDSLVLCQSER